MPVKKITVEEGDKKKDVYIAMTEEEANDRSYMEYLESAEREKTSNEMRKSKPRGVSNVPKEDVAGAMKEYIKYRDEKKNRSGPKYFGGGIP